MLGKKLKEARERANLTQKVAGEKVGLSQQSIYDIERGYKLPSVGAFVRLARLYNVPIDDLAENEFI